MAYGEVTDLPLFKDCLLWRNVYPDVMHIVYECIVVVFALFPLMLPSSKDLGQSGSSTSSRGGLEGIGREAAVKLWESNV